MPTFGDISQFLLGQSFGKTTLPDDVDLSGKTIVVTGSNTGLGFECAKHLMHLGLSKLIIACRDTTKGETARAKIVQDLDSNPTPTAYEVEVWQVDLSSYKSVVDFSRRVINTLDRLDGLVANAGVELNAYTRAEGLETTLTVNVVSTFLMVMAILPKLEDTARTHQVNTNMCIIGSLIHTFGPDSQLSDVPEGQKILDALSNPRTADMQQRYALSKLMAHMCFEQLHRCVSERHTGTVSHEHGPKEGSGLNSQVIVNLVNPGWCGSELGRHKRPSTIQNAMFALIGRTAEQGGRTLVHGVTAGPETHGKYVSECQVKDQSTFMRSARGRTLSQRLWMEVIERVEGLEEGLAAFAPDR